MAENDPGDRVQADHDNMFRESTDGDKVYRRVSVPAVQAKLQEILDAVDGLEGFTDNLEGLLTSANAVLVTIRDNADGVEGFIDGLEGFASAANGLLTTIRDNGDQVETLLATLGDNTDNLEALVTASNGLLTTIRDNADTVETLIGNTNTLLTTIRDNADTVESLLAAIGTNTDTVEGLITSSNALLTTIRDNADTVETLIASTNALLTTSNSLLTAIGSNTDGLEGLITVSNGILATIRDNADTVESLLTSIGLNTDGLEALVTTSNSLLAAIGTNTDGVESLITSTNSLLATIRDNADTVETLLTSIDAGTPNTIGQLPMAASQSVALASDQSPASLNNQSIVAQAAVVPGFVTMIGADDGTNSRRIQSRLTNPLLTDYGIIVRPIPLELAKYIASTNAFILAAAPTDIFRIIGSATKTIRVKKLIVSGRTTSGSPVACIIKAIKYSTANTAGTSVATTAVPLDSNFAAATAACNHYTANPTLGTIIGNVGAHSITFQATGLVEIIEFVFDNPIVLRGVAQQLSINFNSTAVTGSSICCAAEWEEV